MAHGIEIINSVASFAENGSVQRSWHGLGQVYDHPLTVLEAIKGAHADWEVESRKLYYPSAEFGKILMENKPMAPQELMQYLTVVEEKRANVRMDNNNILGVTGQDYSILQNIEAFEFIDMLCNGSVGNACIECCGLLYGGKRVFVTAKLPEPIRVGNNSDDIVDMYIICTTSHDGSSAVDVLVSPIRVCCANTLNMAFKRNSGRLSFRHTLNLHKRLDLTNKDSAERAYKCLHLYNTYKAQFEESLEHLAKIRLDDKQIENILVHSLLTPEVQKIYDTNGNDILGVDIPTRSQNIIENVTDAIETGIGQDILEMGTGLAVINGVTTYYQNSFDWKNDTERKFSAIFGGSVDTKLQNTYANILKVA